MKMNLQGIDIELTPQEFIELQELLHGKKEPKDMTFEEEMNFLGQLRHFSIVEQEVRTGYERQILEITLRSEL